MFRRDKLNIVNHKHVDGTIFFTESDACFGISYRLHIVGDILVRRDVHYAFLRKFCVYVISDCVHKVGFSKPDSAVYKQGIETTAGMLGHGLRRGEGDFVGFPYDKV